MRLPPSRLPQSSNQLTAMMDTSFLPDCIQGLAFPAAGWAPTGEKYHDNDLTFVWRDGGGANRWQGSERLLKIRVELERRSRRREGR
jgi:hypothetical protein